MEAEQDQAEALAREYQHRVGYFASKVARSYMIASHCRDDLVSAGYWGLAKALRDRREDATPREFSAYVSQRIIGAVIDEARSCLTRVTTRETLGGPADAVDAHDFTAHSRGSAADPATSPEDAVSMRHMRERVTQAMAVLGSDERRWLRAYMEGASLRELAESEGVAEGTMRTRFQRAARLLKGRAPDMRRVLRDHEL